MLWSQTLRMCTLKKGLWMLQKEALGPQNCRLNSKKEAFSLKRRVWKLKMSSSTTNREKLIWSLLYSLQGLEIQDEE